MLSSTISVYSNSQRVKYIVDYFYRDTSKLTYFAASSQFFATIIAGAFLIFGSLQAQLMIMGHISVISFATIYTVVTSACFLGGISIVGICLALLLFKRLCGYFHKQQQSEELPHHVSDANSGALGLCRKFGIFQQARPCHSRLSSNETEQDARFDSQVFETSLDPTDRFNDLRTRQ